METLFAALVTLSLLLGNLSESIAANPARFAVLPSQNVQEGNHTAPNPWMPLGMVFGEKETIVGETRYWASVYGVDENLMLFITEHESHFDKDAKNPNSSALGPYQFLTGTWNALCDGERTDPSDSARCAAKILQDPWGVKHWTADETMRRKLVDSGFVKCLDYEKNVCVVEK